LADLVAGDGEWNFVSLVFLLTLDECCDRCEDTLDVGIATAYLKSGEGPASRALS